VSSLTTAGKVEPLVPRDRLESWKEIAAYFSRSERTVRRWEEKEGLPVHRLAHDKRGSVYGYTWELDAWRESRRQLLEAEPTDGEGVAEVATRSRRAPWLAAVGVGAIVVLAGGAWWLARRPERATAHQPNAEAVRLVQLAQFAGNAGRKQLETGIRYLEEAVQLDPAYPLAWSSLATAHLVRVWFGEIAATEGVAQARREAEQAIRLDSSLGPPWRVLAFGSHIVDWDHGRAETEFRRAIELNPRDAAAFSWFADFLLDMRRFDEAREFYRQAHTVAPRWLEPIAFAGNAHFFQGNPDLGIAEYQRALESEPNFGLANHFLGRAYVAKGDYKKGIEYLRKSNELLGQIPFSLGDLGYGLAIAGQRAEAEALKADLVARRARGYYPAFAIAAIESGLGHHDAALAWLERAAEERNMGFYMPSVDPSFDALRSHPRFKALMARARLPVG
jgi:tetratricopeptide (TPR) repeat protein